MAEEYTLDGQNNATETYEQTGQRVRAHLDALAAFSCTRDDPERRGVDRYPHSAEMIQAQQYFIDIATEEGVPHYRDAFGNLYFYLLPDRLEGVTSVVAAGSHIDTVQNAGRLDGNSGSVTAFESMLSINREVRAGTATLTNHSWW